MTAPGTLLLAFIAWGAQSKVGESVDDAIRKFRADYGRPGARDEDRIRAVDELAAHRHEKVAQVLGPLLTRSTVPVRIVTARRLAGFSGIPGVDESLIGALTHYRNSSKACRGVQITILRALGSLRAAAAAPAVDKLVGSPDVWVAKAAIEAAGRIRSASSVDCLIKALARLEGPNGDREIMIDLFEGELPATSMLAIVKQEADEKEKARKTQREVLRDPLIAALSSITKVRFDGFKEWQAWWRTHKRGYVVPP